MCVAPGLRDHGSNRLGSNHVFPRARVDSAELSGFGTARPHSRNAWNVIRNVVRHPPHIHVFSDCAPGDVGWFADRSDFFLPYPRYSPQIGVGTAAAYLRARTWLSVTGNPRNEGNDVSSWKAPKPKSVKASNSTVEFQWWPCNK